MSFFVFNMGKILGMPYFKNMHKDAEQINTAGRTIYVYRIQDGSTLGCMCVCLSVSHFQFFFSFLFFFASMSDLS